VSLASTRSREFWLMIGCAALPGVLGAFLMLAFLGVIKVWSRWFEPTDI
jgi:hypothetical protein